MESWNRIIHTALLGTNKKSFARDEAEPTLASYVDEVIAATPDKEEQFLQLAALHYNYRQCGLSPVHNDKAIIEPAPEEEKQYAPPAAHRALSAVLEAGSASLLNYWLEHCAEKDLIVQPEAITSLLDAVIRQKPLQALALDCCGYRGTWLARFNTAWAYGSREEEDDAWQTGTLEQRKTFLARIRSQDPAQARTLLQEAWPQENAAARTELIKQLSINAGADDLPWLETLLADKSAKVKEAVTTLLKSIPASSIVQAYWKIVQSALRLKKERGLLGLTSKDVLVFDAPGPIDESIYKSGIEKVSSEKNSSDDAFLLYQLMLHIPPSFLQAHLGIDRQQIIKLLLQSAEGQQLLMAIGQAAIRFDDRAWMQAVITADSKNFYPDALGFLPQPEAEAYALRFIDTPGAVVTVIDRATQFGQEWSPQFASAVLAFTSQQPYQYHRSFYSEIIHLLPPAITPELDRFMPKEDYQKHIWNGVREEIKKLLALKLETRKAFKENI